MSLINDALKRARQSQKQQPPTDGTAPPLRPVDSPPRPSFWPFLILPLLLAVVLALAGIFLWRWIDQMNRPPAQTATNSRVVASSPTPAPLPASAVQSNSAITNLPVATNLTLLAATNSAANTTVTVAELPPVPPPPPPLKLQAIFYTRKNPSAVINGKIRAIGDRIGAAQLIAVGPESVTVIVAGKTNELVLP